MCAYDGTNKRSAAVVELSAHPRIAVCPEVEVGMGVRAGTHSTLVAAADGVRSAGAAVRLQGVHSGEDWTERMQDRARDRVSALPRSVSTDSC